MRAILHVGFCIFLTVPLLFAASGGQTTSSPTRKPNEKDPATSTLQQFEPKYRNARSLSATFLERYSENGTLVRAESGTALFLHPGKMRWQYEAPERNLFLVDGKFSWFYAPADHTATRLPARQSDDVRTPFALLAGELKLSRLCAKVGPSTSIPAGVAGNFVFECKLKDVPGDSAGEHSGAAAKSESSTELVFFELSPGAELARILVRSSGGIQTEFIFKNWQFNPPLAAALFQFKAPPGAVIVNGLLPSSPAIRP